MLGRPQGTPASEPLALLHSVTKTHLPPLALQAVSSSLAPPSPKEAGDGSPAAGSSGREAAAELSTQPEPSTSAGRPTARQRTSRVRIRGGYRTADLAAPARRLPGGLPAGDAR